MKKALLEQSHVYFLNVFMATSFLKWQGWLSETKTMWPTNLTVFTLIFYKIGLPISGLS